MQYPVIIFGLLWATGVLTQHNATSSCINCTVRYNFSCPNNLNFNNLSEQYEVIKSDKNIACNSSNYARLFDELKHVESSRNLKELLENRIHWHVRIFQRKANTFSSSNISANYNSIFFPRLCDTCDEYNDIDNEDVFVFYFEKHYIIVAVIGLGLASLMGNGITIIHEIRTLIKQKNTPSAKERKLYNILVLNLCLADLLMGIYVIAGPIARVVLERINFNLCNAMGVASALSTQVSASILMIITAYRLYGVLYPYKPVRVKLAVGLLVFVWLAWIIIVSLPLFNESLFAHEFTREIVVNDRNDEKRFTEHITKVSRTVQYLANAIDGTDEPFSRLLVEASKFPSNQVAVQLLKSFNLVDFESKDTRLINYYSSKIGCTLEILIEARNTTTTYFSLFILSFNLAGYLFILFAYTIIFKNISTLRFKNFLLCNPLKCFSKKQNPQAPKVIIENRQVYVRIFVVVVTDLICGITICLIGLGHYLKGLVFDCSQNRSYEKLATPFILILFPLNSVINPYIYSFHLWKRIFKRCKQRLKNSLLS